MQLGVFIARVVKRKAVIVGIALLLLLVLIAMEMVSPLLALIAVALLFGWAVVVQSEFRSPDAPAPNVAPIATGSPAAPRAWPAVVNSVPRPLIVLDPSAHVIYANPAAHALFGAISEGRHVSLTMREPDVLAAIDRTLADQQIRSADLRERVPIERRLRAIISPVQYDDHPTANGEERPHDGPTAIVFVEDNTVQDQLARTRADFVANASHELRTPLTSLMGYLETLQQAAKDDPEARERFIRTMQEQADRMSRLIDDLLLLSKVTEREHLTPRTTVDLNAVVAQVMSTLSPIANKTNVKLNFIPLESPAVITGVHDELVQVFQNLVQNAIKYGGDGGQVDATISHTPSGGLAVAISDDGPGIAKQHLPRLTERFYRVSPAHGRDVGGTGLGLAIVKHIVNRHRAELHIVSQLGTGSTFTVLFDKSRELSPRHTDVSALMNLSY